MRIAIMSDIHDNIWQLEKALKRLDGVQQLIFCGDFCAPFTLKQIAKGFSGPVHAVFGNNDGDRYLLMKIAAGFAHVYLHGEFAELEADGVKIAVNHYPDIARPIAESGRYGAVFYGHNHIHKIEKVQGTDLINPGEIMGRFGRSTFVFYDLQSRECETIEVE